MPGFLSHSTRRKELSPEKMSWDRQEAEFRKALMPMPDSFIAATAPRDRNTADYARPGLKVHNPFATSAEGARRYRLGMARKAWDAIRFFRCAPGHRGLVVVALPKRHPASFMPRYCVCSKPSRFGSGVTTLPVTRKEENFGFHSAGCISSGGRL